MNQKTKELSILFVGPIIIILFVVFFLVSNSYDEQAMNNNMKSSISHLHGAENYFNAATDAANKGDFVTAEINVDAAISEVKQSLAKDEEALEHRQNDLTIRDYISTMQKRDHVRLELYQMSKQLIQLGAKNDLNGVLSMKTDIDSRKQDYKRYDDDLYGILSANPRIKTQIKGWYQ